MPEIAIRKPFDRYVMRVNVKVTREARVRLALAKMCFRLGAWIGGGKAVINDDA